MAAAIDPSRYSHSPAHAAVLAADHAALRRLLSSLPPLLPPSSIHTEPLSLSEEAKADAIAAVLDRRDVPARETPLHLAVRLSDPVAVDILMSAGADWSLQNEAGWSPLQEAICNGEEAIARIIVRHYQPLAWAKWCRRLPRLVATMSRMRDFYMEITFHFESSVIPFISRIAPSDTYKIWKRGANLRADMTLAGFDGFRIQRSDQTILFLGDEAEGGKLVMISHKEKEVMNALNGAAAPATEEEVEQEVAAMSRTNIFRPGIDVTQAVLLPQVNWRGRERVEGVGEWKASVYDMHNVVVSVRSRRVPGAVTDDELLNENETETESEFGDVLTEEERRQLEATLKMESPDHVGYRRSGYEERKVLIDDASCSSSSNGGSKQERKGWFGGWGKGGGNAKQEQDKPVPPRSSLSVDEKVSDLLTDSPSSHHGRSGRHSVELGGRVEDAKRGRERRKEGGRESEYKKGLRPVLWLSPSFPLRTEELLPLLDILANKVKAIRRLRELLTTKLPPGTFPVKVAIPVIPTIRVLVTFTKFEELQSAEEFSTPPSSPGSKSPVIQQPSGSWLQWIKAPYGQNQSVMSGPSSRVDDIQDPFMIPPDYTWTTPEARKKKMKEKENKGKSKKGRSQNQ